MELSVNNNQSIIDEEKGRTEGEPIQYIVVRLGEEQYGIDIRNIDNIVKMQRITRVPKLPAYLKGVINMRGEVIPVLSIRLKMGLEADEITKATRILIVKLEEEGNVGFIVDEVKEVVTLYESDIEKISSDLTAEKGNLINAVGKHNGELISLFDLAAISLEEN
ncbi:MAG: chemotaxis protein CheW [Eubacterium sp.]|nr:chemotaxis protein CheW [Eubacterium sp.]MCM1216222.1 chemotaxis protein CheW [Lachnospiraceae bacterium]MCM1304331.1 chemotaxis protein CheW [Butyrivibrio sp.]MCM1344325.1 chemotaxis protein CheW [Muribaculaceae bacterium]MCM1238840.1 chemotaxis protein CheW [Lachnospiraceae bacterium]